MRILVVAMKFFPASGGSATYAHHLAQGLHNQGHQVRLLAPQYKRKIISERSDYEIIRMPLTNEAWYGIRIIVATISIIRHYWKFRPDVIWSSTFAGCRSTAVLAFLPGRWIGTIHGGGMLRSDNSRGFFAGLSTWLGNLFIRRADAIVTISNEAEKLIRNTMPEKILQSKLKVIYNGIAFDPTAVKTKEEALTLWPQWRNRKIVLTVGRLVEAKGHDLVIEAVHRLRYEIPEILYIIVGEGNTRKNLEMQVKKLGLENHVFFAGYVEASLLENYYAVADVFAMPGRVTREFVEGFGLVFVEAGMRGKAVIGTKVGGITEAIRDGYSGLLIAPENVESLSEAVKKLIFRPEETAVLGKQGREWTINNFSLDVMARHNDKLLFEIFWRKREISRSAHIFSVESVEFSK